MMIQCAKHVTCPIDGKPRTFFFLAIREGDSYRPGIRHGCNDKTGRLECSECWRRVRAEVFLHKK